MIIYPDTGTTFQAAGAVTVDEGGTPSRLFRKDVITPGRYVKDDREFTVTPASLEHWVKVFHEMREDGLRIPIPATHPKDGDSHPERGEPVPKGAPHPDDNRGYVKDLFIDGDMLVMTAEIRGQKGLDAVQNCDVSLNAPPMWPSGKGKEYPRPITHIALVTDPVVPGLGEFIPLAASLSHKENTVMKLTKTLKVLGIEEELTPDNADGLLSAAIVQLQEEHASQSETNKGKLETVEASLATEQAKGAGRTPDPVTVKLLGKNRASELEDLVRCGNITPAVRDRLSKRFVETERLTLCLAHGDDTFDGFDDVVAALKVNHPKELKEFSGAQARTIALSQGGGDEKPAIELDAEARAKDAKEYGLVTAP